VAGAVVLAVAIGMLGCGFLTLGQLVKDPGRLDALQNHVNVTSTGPNASFTWTSQGYNVTFTDTSTDHGSTITIWAWEFGDGTPGYLGRTPPTHTYRVTCPGCTEQVTLAVSDAADRQSVATAHVVLQSLGSSSGTGQSPNPASNVPSLGPLTTGVPGALELLLIMFLIGGSVARAGWMLLRREPETVQVPVRPRTALGE